MIRRTKFWVVLIAMLVVALAVGCNAPAPPPAPASSGGEAGESAAAAPATVRIGWAGSPDSLNPGVAVLAEAYTLFDLIYDSMYQLELDGTYTPELAESVDVSEDGTVWTFKLRDGFTFHDGTPLTAEDVAFSYNFYKNHEEFPFLNVYTAYFDSIEATDESTVVITLSEAIPNMESQLIYLYALPKHIWEAYDAEGAADFANDEMIGSGAFKLTQYEQNQFVQLAAVKDHPLYPPKIDGAIFQTFDNQDGLVQALRTGQVDMIMEMPATAVPGLRNDSNIELVVGPPAAPSVTDIFFNLVTPENCPPDDGACTGHPALLDRNVRLALAHATDKQQIIDVVLLGLGNPGLTLIPDSLGFFYNDSLQDYEFDLDKANQILDDAGYLDTNNDGVREMPDGSRDLTLRMNWPSDSTNAPRMAEILNGLWSQIGVKTELQALDPDALTAVCCPAFDFDVILWGWGSDPDPAFLLSVMTTDEIPTGTSETGYSNPTYDELFAQQAVELDQEKRRDIVWEMQKIVFDDVVYIIPFYAANVQAFRTDRFQGWITDAGKVELSDITSMWKIEPVQ
ncbi:MAG TPA: ABC transporter substrate-binding protein [Caldilinea sp.]|nr:ABC transporter substrate-binding protein [Caldilinea sp.]